jgi:hypothetical protein
MHPGHTAHKFVIILNRKIDLGVALKHTWQPQCPSGVDTVPGRAQRQELKPDPDGAAGRHRGGDHVRRLHRVDDRDTHVEQMERTRATAKADLDYWGICLFGRKEEVDPITRRFSLWRT